MFSKINLSRFCNLRISDVLNFVIFVFSVISVFSLFLWFCYFYYSFTLSCHTKSQTCLVILLEHFVFIAHNDGSWTCLAWLKIFIIFIIGRYEGYPTNKKNKIKKSIQHTNIFTQRTTSVWFPHCTWRYVWAI